MTIFCRKFVHKIWHGKMIIKSFALLNRKLFKLVFFRTISHSTAEDFFNGSNCFNGWKDSYTYTVAVSRLRATAVFRLVEYGLRLSWRQVFVTCRYERGILYSVKSKTFIFLDEGILMYVNLCSLCSRILILILHFVVPI